ncbi:MAG: YgfZ/GcvT domain-containing protein [Bdellovibrionia bacterium]
MIRTYDPETQTSSSSSAIHWNWLTLGGRDAQDFLHRLSTVHVKALQPGQGKPGCILNAQGKIRASFMLWNLKKDLYAFEWDGGQLNQGRLSLISLIDELTFGEKMELKNPSTPVRCLWLWGEDEELQALIPELPTAGHVLEIPLPQEAAGLAGETPSLHLGHHGKTQFGRTWLTLWGEPQNLNRWLKDRLQHCGLNTQSVELQEMEQWRIQALRPRVDFEITTQANPLEIGLRDAISDQKGCYPGQEVIERTLALGSPARNLVQIEGTGPAPTVGEPLWDASGSLTTPQLRESEADASRPALEVGVVTSSQPLFCRPSGQSTAESFIALALVRKTHAKKGAPLAFQKPLNGRGTVVQIAPYAEKGSP